MRWLPLLLLLAFLLASCAGAAQPPTAGTDVAQTPTSAPVASGSPSYPYPYPGPAGTDPTLGPAFSLDAPILTSKGMLSGTGPAGVPIRLVNFMRNAEVVGETVIGEDGSFSVPVTEIAPGDIIGLVLGDLTGTDLKAEDFVRGPGYKDVIGFGIVFDSEVVLE
jgi:hypothetical protein